MGRIPVFLIIFVCCSFTIMLLYLSLSVLVIPDFFIPFCEKQRDFRSGPGFSLLLVSSSFSLQVMRLTVVIYYLQNVCGKPGCKVNRTRLSGSFQRKISGTNGTSEIFQTGIFFHFFKAIFDTSFRTSR